MDLGPVSVTAMSQRTVPFPVPPTWCCVAVCGLFLSVVFASSRSATVRELGGNHGRKWWWPKGVPPALAPSDWSCPSWTGPGPPEQVRGASRHEPASRGASRTTADHQQFPPRYDQDDGQRPSVAHRLQHSHRDVDALRVGGARTHRPSGTQDQRCRPTAAAPTT